MRRSRLSVFTMVLAIIGLSVSVAGAQEAGIAGSVTDATGGVLPGVSVEVSSPALIEGSRVAVTDGQGQYRVTALVTGVYSVTFSLPGFNTVEREGLELNVGFTATVDAEMRVGSVEETVTVTGASPVVDIQNVRSQNVLTREVLDAAPVAKNFQSLADLTVGVYLPTHGNPVDVGGVKGETYAGLSTHGGAIGFTLANGMRTNTATNFVTNTRYQHNQLSVQEVVLETGAVSAEQLSGGVNVNMVPKEGGNAFSGVFLGEFANDGMQGDNFTERIKARGLSQGASMRQVHDIGVAFGGPIVRDKVWFYTAHRDWGGLEEVPSIYHNKLQHLMMPGNEHLGLRWEADLSKPGLSDNYTKDNNLRLTFQAGGSNKVSLYGALQDFCMCPLRYRFSAEGVYGYHFSPNNLFQATWTAPLSNRLLLEAGWTLRKEHHLVDNINGAGMGLSVNERTKGVYGSIWSNSTTSRGAYGDHGNQGQWSTRFAASYVTGSHAFKVGATTFIGGMNIGGPNVANTSNIQRVFRNGVPEAINLAAYPHHHQTKVNMDLGIFVQDQWTLGNLTLNLGVRFDQLVGSNPAQCRPSGDYTAEFCFDEIGNSPNWKDISPRMGAAYDLFGDGRTALKFSVGRYVKPSATQVASLTNPASAIAAATSRAWTDTNGDFMVDCDVAMAAANGECGPNANSKFGTILQQRILSTDITEGWHIRNHNWQGSVVIEHELGAGLAMKVGYFRTAWGNGGYDGYPGSGTGGFITDNLATARSDYDEFCITAPTDSRLGPASGSQVCNLQDVTPSKYGKVDNLVTHVDNYGGHSYVFDGVDASMSLRFGDGGLLNGGVSLGTQRANQCNVADKPAQFCEFTKGIAAFSQVKFNGSYPLPYDMMISGTFMNMPGIVKRARYYASNADINPGLGRNLAGGRKSLRIDLLEPFSQFEDRMTRVDIRFAKNIQAGNVRIQPRVDLYNVFNADTIIGMSNSYGSRLYRPSAIIAARFFKVGLDVRF